MTESVTKLPRRDKKTMIKPELPNAMIDVLTEKAKAAGFITTKAGETVGAPSPYTTELILQALHSEYVTRGLTPYFRRGYVPRWDKSRVMMGHVIAPKLEPLMPEGEDMKRFPVKFLPDDHLAVGEVAYSLGCSLAQACVILINEALIQGVEVESKREEAM